jgi:rare lipoprotein A (peptidoglycan hydrolase)
LHSKTKHPTLHPVNGNILPLIMKMGKLVSLLILLCIAVCVKAQEQGLASVYSPKFQSKFTASGEPFSHSELTASHRKLPFGTMVKITRPDNGKSVVVRITDRGPFVNGYVTNLSKAAALRIGMLGDNTEAPVKIEVISEPKTQISVTAKPKPHTESPPIHEEMVEVTSKGIKEHNNVPNEYRTVVTPNNNVPPRFTPSAVQKKKVKL